MVRDKFFWGWFILSLIFGVNSVCGQIIITVPDDVPTFAEAYEKAKNGDVILLKAGEHTIDETLTIEKSVTFRGEAMDQVVVRSECDQVMNISNGKPVFERISFVSTGKDSLIWVTYGTPRFSDCLISAKNGIGVDIEARGLHLETLEEAESLFERCQIVDCGLTGVRVYGGGALSRGAKFVSCKIYRNNNYCVHTTGPANPQFIDCTIIAGNNLAIWASSQGQGIFRGCKIHSTNRENVLADRDGALFFEDCHIEGGWVAVGCMSSGSVKLIGCRLYSRMYPVGCGTEGHCRLEKCEIQGQLGGIAATQGGTGHLSECRIEARDPQNGTAVGVHGKSRVNLQNCTIISPKYGVLLEAEAGGSFFNNRIECPAEPWKISPNAGMTTGSGNTPEMPAAGESDFLKILMERTKK